MADTRETPITLHIPGGRSVSARWTEPTAATDAGWAIVYAPGAGSNLDDPFGRLASRWMADHGIATLCFQFPYMEQGRRTPDRLPVLEATWNTAIAAARDHPGRLAIGGRSMGGRVASLVVATGQVVDALILFAYPLHPPGHPDQSRDAHLASIGVPTLFCSGTRDGFATPEELRSAMAAMADARLHVLEGADHGYSVLRSSGRTRQDVWAEAAQAAIDWLLDPG